MMRTRLLLASLAATLANGCLVPQMMNFVRSPVAPMPAWEVRMDPDARRECLVVLLPGLFDIPDDLFTHGFIDDALAASTRCDFLVVDAHVGYYQNGEITDRLTADVLVPANARGYSEIWITGISMGALGGALLAERRPSAIRGLVMIAPWLGDEGVVRSVHEAGGLHAWVPPPIDRVNPRLRDATIIALVWLRDHGEDASPELHLAVGEQDRWAHMAELVSEVVPAERRTRAAGGHDWATWRTLWRRVLESPPWDPAIRPPASPR